MLKMKLSKFVFELISSTPFLEFYLENKILNQSALSKKIHQYVSNQGIETNESSVLMALKRFTPPFKHKLKHVSYHISDAQQITVNSNLNLYRVEKNNSLIDIKEKLLKIDSEKYYLKIYETENSVSLVLSSTFDHDDILPDDLKIIETKSDLSSVNLKFNSDDIRIPGLYYILFKQFAWNNINIYEITSSGREITLLIDNKDVKNVFKIIQQQKINLF